VSLERRNAHESSPGTEVRIRRMAPTDLDQMMELALSLEHAPHWPRSAYAVALDPEAAPRRITLIAETPLSGVILGFAVASLLPPQAELETIAVATKWQRRGVARRILTAMTEELRTAMITEVLLEVRASNSAASHSIGPWASRLPVGARSTTLIH